MKIWFNKTFSTIAAVLRNLRQAGGDSLTLVCTHNHMAATAFLQADEAYLEPTDLTGQTYVAWCLQFCQQHHIDIFWPGKEAALLSRAHPEFLAIGTRILSVADFATLTLLGNKANFYRNLSSDVAMVMDFRVAHDLTSFDTAVAELASQHSKLCIKPAVSVYGLGFRILDTERASISHILKGVEYQIPLQELRQGMAQTGQFEPLLVMECLDGPEWSVDCVGHEGHLLAAVQRKKSLLPGHGQSIDNHTDIATMVIRLAQHYRLNGVFNIQFKEGRSGVRLLEINPRPSGGFGMACLAGADLAYMALQAFNGEIVSPPTIRLGLVVNEVKVPVVVQV
jgi:ATP-grasp in the biosynthetic pathway with Ter operon